ncbi:MAG: hypothetical protein HUJ71_09005 [Pseudobutyrivibrio sp.]|nr:hypothetical protein [Pseudobutyrivibrio sp.]
MNISGIRPSIGFYDYNSIRPVQRPQESVPEIKPVEQVEHKKPQITEEEISQAREKQTFGAYDYATTYNPDETFEMKGADSDINSLDVEKAVNDMQKDSMLRQYQYFIGNQAVDTTADSLVGTIRGSEDFSL